MLFDHVYGGDEHMMNNVSILNRVLILVYPIAPFLFRFDYSPSIFSTPTPSPPILAHFF